ncbi:MAG: hypothetical protein ACOC6P_03310 [Candidatus Aminicenantaceae bacterium]
MIREQTPFLIRRDNKKMTVEMECVYQTDYDFEKKESGTGGIIQVYYENRP